MFDFNLVKLYFESQLHYTFIKIYTPTLLLKYETKRLLLETKNYRTSLDNIRVVLRRLAKNKTYVINLGRNFFREHTVISGGFQEKN